MGKVSNLFSPRYYSTQLENHKEILEHFRPYLNDPKYFSNDFSNETFKWGCEVETTIGNDHAKAMPWHTIKDRVEIASNKMVDSYNPIRKYDVAVCRIWANIYKKYDFQEIHDHSAQDAHFSFAYILEQTESNKNAQFQFVNENSSYRYIFPVNSVRDSVSNILFRPDQQQGTLLIFPSDLRHHVTQHLSDMRRVTISGDITVIFR